MMTRSELIAALEKRGHKRFPFLVKQSPAALKALYDSGRHYTPSDATTAVQTANANRPEPATVPVDINASPTIARSKFGEFGEQIAAEVTPAIIDAVRESLRAEFDAALDDRPVKTELTVNLPDRSIVLPADICHEREDDLLALQLCGTSVYIHGPAGSGKSYAAENIARKLTIILGRPIAYHHVSFSEQSQLHELLGIPPINGHPAGRTALWEAWQNGGVVLLDEIDRTPGFLVALNAGLANNRIVFADGQNYNRHPDCYIVAAGNTTMRGQSMDYISAVRIDGASVDRFAFLEWGYDEKLELAVAGTDQVKWTRHVQSLRKACTSLGASAPDLLITPRASYNGAKYLRVNPDATFAQVEEFFVWKGLPEDDRSKIRQALKA